MLSEKIRVQNNICHTLTFVFLKAYPQVCLYITHTHMQRLLYLCMGIKQETDKADSL